MKLSSLIVYFVLALGAFPNFSSAANLCEDTSATGSATDAAFREHQRALREHHHELQELRDDYFQPFATLANEASILVGQPAPAHLIAVAKQILASNDKAEIMILGQELRVGMMDFLEAVLRQLQREQSKKALPQHNPELILRVYSEVMQECSIYVSGACYNNVNRLFRAMQRKIPDLDAREFRVLQLKRTDGHSFRIIRDQNNLFDYHIFLRFGDLILDPDFSRNANPVSIEQYVDQFLLPAELPRLGIQDVWGLFYLSWSDRAVGKDYFQDVLWFESQVMDFTKYLKVKASRP